MYRVLIADAEPLVRAGIKSSINWEHLGLEVVGEAESGKETLELVQIHKPHILLLELFETGVNGIDVLQEVLREETITKVIVINAANDYKTVRLAMKLGAYDYLLKASFNAKALEQLLIELRQDFHKRGVTQLSRAPIHLQQTKMFRKLLLQECLGNNFIQELHEAFPTCGYTICCFSVLRKQSNAIDKVYNFFLEERSDFSQVCHFRLRDNQIIGVVFHTQDPDWISNYVNVMIASVYSCLQITCAVCVSGVATSYEDFACMYAQAVGGLEESFYLLAPKIVYCDETTKKFLSGEKEPELDKLMQELKQCIEYDLLEQLNNVTLEVFKYLKRKRNVLPKIVKNDFINIINQCANVLRRMGFLSCEIDQLFAYTDIAEKEDIFELEYWMMAFIEKYKVMVVKAGGEIMRNVQIMKSVRYLEENFAEHLTLLEIAKQANLSVSYFSTLFKKVTGTGVIEYLNLKRINAAKEKIASQPDCRVSEIACEVGFDSIPYFSKTFKNTVGVTAAEYKKMHFKN